MTAHLRIALLLTMALQGCAFGPLACDRAGSAVFAMPVGAWRGIGFSLLVPAGDLCRQIGVMS